MGMVSDGKSHRDRRPIAQGKTMAEPQETQQEKETRWAAQRAAHDTQQQDSRRRGHGQGEKLVGCGSHRDRRCGDCCGHAAVKSGWWDIRCGHTEEGGRFLYTEGDRERWAQTATAIPRDGRLFQSINPQRSWGIV